MTDFSRRGLFGLGASLAAVHVLPDLTPAPAGFYFRVDDQEKVRLSASGSIGMGTTTPNTRLVVRGAVGSPA